MTMTAPVALVDELAAIRAEILRRRKPETLALERYPDVLDQIVATSTREQAALQADRDAAMLARVEDALARIKAHEYGVCMCCGEAISEKRLAVVPYAERCRDCQQKAEVA